MNGRRAHGPSARTRLSWAIFGAASALALGSALLMASSSGGRVTVGMTFLGGAVIIGIAAALLHAIVSPMPDHVGRAYGGSGYGVGFFDGGSGGFGGDGGGAGGGGGDGGCG